MKNRISSLILALVMLLEVFSIFPSTVFAEGNRTSGTPNVQETEAENNYIEGMVKITCDGSNHVALEKGDKLYAFTELDSSLGKKAKYSWEIMTENNKWAAVSGYVFYFAVISEALLYNAKIVSGEASVRCIVTVGDNKYVSDVLTVAIPQDDASPSQSEATPKASVKTRAYSMRTSSYVPELLAEDGEFDAFQIVINYTYRHNNCAPGLALDGKNAANTFTVTLQENTYYTGTVATPPEIGYLPYVTLDQEKYVTGTPVSTDYIEYDGVQYVLANSISFDNQSDDVTINVFFIPQEVTFRIKIYEQNLYDDEYTLAETITKRGIANSPIGEDHDTPRVGFSPLYYDPKLSIDEDGSMALDIYYDRIYYLLDLDLNDNGDAFGAVNHYVRYETTVVIPPPTRPGYDFINWTLVSVKNNVKDTESVTEHSYPMTADGGYVINSIEHNVNYLANWKVGKTSYTVIYWLENANDDGFTLDSFKVVNDITPGTPVDAKNDLDIPDASCFTFSEALSDKGVIVSSDGTTAVNAYYLREYYTMSFKGDTKCITKPHTHSDACLSGNCDLEPHTHTDQCGKDELICGKTEHVHVDSCCELEEHIHNEEEFCCTIPYHVHGTGASSDCTKTEHPLHHDSCYSRNALKDADSLTDNNQKTAYNTLVEKIAGPLNGYVYRIRTKRNSTIYNFLYVHNHWFYLGTSNNYNGVTASVSNPSSSAGSYSSGIATAICGYELHTHGDGTCDCPITEHDHTSGCTCPIERHAHGEGDCLYTLCGEEQHRHSINCYSYQCGKQVHAHTANCVRGCQQIEHTHTNACETDDNKTFLQFKAKYDADISKIWQNVWEKFSGGERWDANTYYSEVLVYLPFMPPANITFSKDVGTATKIYNINYYLESLDGQGKYYDEKYFELNNTVNAKYGYLTPAEDFFDIVGFTQHASDPAFDKNNQISTSNGGPVSLYYSRNDYLLEFVSLGTTLSKLTQTLKYQQPIGSQFEVMAEDIPYPSNKESGAIRFVGWYSTPNCADGTEFHFDGSTTMPVGGLVLYAKWEACSYTVSVYSNVEKEEELLNETVLFDSFIIEPDYIHIQHPDGLPDHEHPGYDDEKHLIFAGWYYVVDGEEKRFDFNTMTVKADMVIYAKWTSRIPVNYTVRYVYFDGEKYVDIAKPTTGASLAGMTKNFVAKVTTDLYDGYRVNYFPEIRSHSLTMSSEESENVFLFVYSSQDEIEYTVNHQFTANSAENIALFEKLFGSGNTSLNFKLSHTIKGENIKVQAASVAVSFREGVTKNNIVLAAKEQYGVELSDADATSLWNAVTTMSPDYFIQDLILTTNAGQNNATFKWNTQAEQARYQIIYYIESVDGSEYLINSTKTGLVNKGTLIQATTENGMVIDIEYFEFNKDHPDTIIQGTATSTSVGSDGTLNKGLVLKLYYTRKEYSYTVQYYKEGSTVSLADPVELKAKYQDTIYISDVAKEIPGYTLINGDHSEKKDYNNNQTFICYYQGLEVYYQYQIIGMGATIKDPTDTVAIGGNAPKPKKLEIWNEGYFLNAWYYSIGDGERKAVPASWLSKDGEGNAVVSVPAPEIDLAGKTVYVFAEVLPTTRRFSVEGFATWENDPQAFVFRLTGKAGTQTAGIDITFTIFDIGYVDISHLPYGEYTLTTLHWAWRFGHPTSVTFNGNTYDALTGTVNLNLNTTGDVIITYPSDMSEQWLTDDASSIIPLEPKND